MSGVKQLGLLLLPVLLSVFSDFCYTIATAQTSVSLRGNILSQSDRYVYIGIHGLDREPVYLDAQSIKKLEQTRYQYTTTTDRSRRNGWETDAIVDCKKPILITILESRYYAQGRLYKTERLSNKPHEAIAPEYETNVAVCRVAAPTHYQQHDIATKRQDITLRTGVYNVGSRYIFIARKGNRICYEGISAPSGRYAVAVGETTGSVSQEGAQFIINGWRKYGKTVTLHHKGRNLVVTHDNGWSGEYEFLSDKLWDGGSESLNRCLNSSDVFFETAPGYTINR